MRIEKTNIQITRTHLPLNEKQKKQNTTATNTIKEYTPPYYQDYNITFGARLFRTPANFFEQDFNRNGMPDTMKEYLYDDYEDRQNIPPAQMMKIVFGDVKEAKSLEEVKRLYPEEKLFTSLTDTPAVKSRTGVLAEIELMKGENNSLFKNGQDNLGLYILKKIYIEGKTLKEINKDFEKDISVRYKGLSPIDYRTLSAFGIKYPNTAFWKSFIATRADFPYEYKPRKAIESRIMTEPQKQQEKKTSSAPVKKKFDNVKDWEIDKLSDAVINGKGNAEETKRQFKKRNIRDDVKESFVMKYLGEINTVVLEKVHASEEMIDFWENYENLSASQKTKLEDYWKSDPQIRDIRSQAMKDTIKLFMESYGVDGNNEEFRDLLDYAHSIKPARIAKQKEHDRIQAEYDELFASLTDVEEKADIKTPEVPEKSPDEILRELAVKNGAKVYEFEGDDGEIYTYVMKVDEEFSNILREEVRLLPRNFQNRYLNFMLKSPLAVEDYKESVIFAAKAPEFVQKRFMQPETYRKISMEINKQFDEAYPQVMRATDQAMTERLLSSLPDKYSGLLLLNTNQLMTFATETLHIDEWSTEDRAILEKDYADYLKPIQSQKETQAIYRELVSFLERIDSIEELPFDDSYLADIVKLLAANLKSHPNIKSRLLKDLRETRFVESYGGSARLLLKQDAPQSLKDIKSALMMEELLASRANIMSCALACDLQNIKKYIKEPELKKVLIEKYFRLELA